MNAVLDVLKLRRVKLDYISPPVCPGVSVTSSSGSGSIWVDMGDESGWCPPGFVWDDRLRTCVSTLKPTPPIPPTPAPPTPPPPSTGCITNSDSLSSGTVGTAYAQTLACAFGTGPRTFSTTDALPDGLTLNSSGVISGTPTTAGTTSFTVTATDSLGALCTDVCQVTVVPLPIEYYGLVLSAYYQGNNTPIQETGGTPLSLPSPVSSGYTVTVHLTGNHLELGGWIQVTGHIGSPTGPVFNTGYIAVPSTSIPYPSLYPVTWTTP